MKKKLLLILIGLLFFANVVEIKAFPEKLTSISQKGYVAYGSLGGGYSAALKKSNEGYIVICAKYHATTPAKGIKTCNLTRDWSKEIRAGVAYIIRTANISNSLTKANSNYVDTELAISVFLYKKNAGGDYISDRRVKTSWVNGAINTYNTVSQGINNISISIGSINVTQDDINFYLTVPIITSYDYTVTVKKGSTTYSKSGDKYVIPKSTLSDGDNTINISATATYSWYQARKYDCGSRYQPVTPNSIEWTQLTSKDASKEITLKKESKGNIKVNIYDNATKILITNPDRQATFQIYSGLNCSGTKVGEKIETRSGFYQINSLSQGSYSIEEVKAPNDYIESTEKCVAKNVTVTSGGTTSVDVYYNQGCQVKLENSDKSVNSLIKLYNEFKFRGLLNFSNPSCGNVKCDSKISTNCLSLTNDITDFNENNLSCYDSDGAIQDEYGNYIGFCKNYFLLNNELGTNTFAGISGQFLSKANLAATATSTKTCYILNDKTATIGDPLPLELYFGDNNSDKIADKLVSNSTPNPLETPGTIGSFTKYTNSTLYNFFLRTVYLEKITGKVINNPVVGSIQQQGLILPFNSNFSGYIPFKIKYGTEEIIDDSCTYTSIPELIKFENNDSGKLNIAFRTINTSTPFLKKNGDTRNTGNNWCEKDSNDNIVSCSGDITKNKIIENTIRDRNNSYNQTKKGALYTITLTPSTIKEIKSYNKNTTFDDYNVNCDDTGSCVNSFLSRFNIKRTNLDG